MSGFKRYQSKVFWNQMEVRDLGKPQELLSLSNDENLDSVQESDTTDPENTTVIHIELCASPDRR